MTEHDGLQGEDDSPFRIGNPPARPGESPKFPKWEYKPEDLKRLDPLKCTSKDTEPHAFGLIRVLDDDFQAKGEWNPKLNLELRKN